MPLHYTLIPKGTPTVRFEQLSDVAKQKAIHEVVQAEIKAYKDYIAEARAKVNKANINAIVNDRYNIIKLYNTLKSVNKFKDTNLIEKIILSNMIDFLSDGTYVVYLSPTLNN